MPDGIEIGQQVDWREIANSLSPESLRTARMWLGYTLFYWLIPTVIVMVGLLVARQAFKLLDLIIHGEFLIYAITLTAGSTRLITKDIQKQGPFVNRQEFNLCAQIIILPAIFVYGLLRYFGFAPSQNGINVPLVVTYSVLLLVAAFYFSYTVFKIDIQRTAQLQGDVQMRASQAITHSTDKLKSDFNAIQGIEPKPPEPEPATDLDTPFDALEEGQ